MPLTKVSSSLINTVSASQIVATGASAGQVLTYNESTSTWVASAAPSGNAINSSATITLSGQTSVDFTGIPSTAKRITVMMYEVSTNGTGDILIQVGAGSIQTSGYISSGGRYNFSVSTGGASSTAGFIISVEDITGHMQITHLSSNRWVSSHNVKSTTSVVATGGGSVALSATLDRVRFTTVSGTELLNSGFVSITWE